MPQIVEFEGQQHEFPDDASDAEIAQMLGGAAPAAPALPPAPSMHTTGFTAPAADQNLRNEPAPSPLAGLARALQVGLQGTGAGVAHAALAPVDLIGGLQNLISGGINSAFGTSIPMARPASEMATDAASKAFEVAGGKVIPKEAMSDKEKLAYNISDYGTQAATMGTALAAAAPARMTTLSQGGATKLGDAFVRPYFNNAPSTVVGDVASGVGSGIAVNAAEDMVAKDSPWAPLATGAAALVGGVGGAATKEGLDIGLRGVGNAFTRGRQDTNIPVDPKNLQPVNRGTAETASRMMQEVASNPNTAARNIRDNADEMARANLPQPTVGLVSGDVGLQSAESAARTKNGVPFIENDNRLRVAATDRVNSLRDPGADQSAVTAKVQAVPGELAATRDAAALPLLKTAEANPGAVDVKPVIDLIDSKLATAKREPVRNALAKARQSLNKPGTEDVDDTVAGLYESRKAINDIIEGRTENSTGRFAQKELIAVRDVLDKQIAAVSPEFTQYLDEFRTGSKPINALQDSPVATTLIKGEDPRDVARRIFTSNRYDAEKELDEINALVGLDNSPQKSPAKQARVDLDAEVQTRIKSALAKNPMMLPNEIAATAERIWRETRPSRTPQDAADTARRQQTPAARGWRAAVSEVLSDQVSGTAKLDAGTAGPGSTMRVELSKLDKLFADNRPLLAKVYDPADMNRLQQAHAVLEPLKNATVRATGGSNTADKGQQLWRMAEAGLKAKYGVLKGGGYLRTLRVMAQTLPDDSAAVQRLVERAWFDPDIAEYLLTNKVRDLSAEASNKHVRRLIAGAAASRESD